MKPLIEFIAQTLVDEPNQVEVTETEPNRLELRVAEDDLGRMIGRKGSTARAMRALLQAAGRGERIELDISGHGESASS